MPEQLSTFRSKVRSDAAIILGATSMLASAMIIDSSDLAPSLLPYLLFAAWRADNYISASSDRSTSSEATAANRRKLRRRFWLEVAAILFVSVLWMLALVASNIALPSLNQEFFGAIFLTGPLLALSHLPILAGEAIEFIFLLIPLFFIELYAGTRTKSFVLSRSISVSCLLFLILVLLFSAIAEASSSRLLSALLVWFASCSVGFASLAASHRDGLSRLLRPTRWVLLCFISWSTAVALYVTLYIRHRSRKQPQKCAQL